jgi:hypothetical protein
MVSSAYTGIGSRSVCIVNDDDSDRAQPAAAAIGSHSCCYMNNSASSGMRSFPLADLVSYNEETADAGGSSSIARRGDGYLHIVKSHALELIDEEEVESGNSSSSHSCWRMRKSAHSNIRSHPLAHRPTSFESTQPLAAAAGADAAGAAGAAAVAGAGNLRYCQLRSSALSSIRSYPLADCAYGYLSAPAPGAVMRGDGRRSSPSCGAMLLSADSGVTSHRLTYGCDSS